MFEMTVIIPTLGRKTIIKTISSLVENKDFSKLEILIIGTISNSLVKSKILEFIKKYSNIFFIEKHFEFGDLCAKRNLGITESHSELVAFLDDDVEVSKEWSAKMISVFKDPMVGLASGPGLIPDNLNLVSRLAGLALSSSGAGIASHRYSSVNNETRDAKYDEVIGCNHVYRKKTIEQIGGYNNEICPGEDLFASWETYNNGWKIKYVPEAWVWHYPRQNLIKFCIQIFRYGAGRMKLIRHGVYNRPSTLVPGFWMAFNIIFVIAGFFWRPAWLYLGLELLLYSIMMAMITYSIVKQTKKKMDLCLWGMLWLMHISYGLGEWLEFFIPSRDLSEKEIG